KAASTSSLPRYEERAPTITPDELVPTSTTAAPLHRHPRTDAGNADRYIDTFGDRLRYLHVQGQWLWWDGSRWRPDTTGKPTEAAKQLARCMVNEAVELP